MQKLNVKISTSRGEVDVHITDKGEFLCDIGQDQLRADSLAALTKKARAFTKKKALSIKIMRLLRRYDADASELIEGEVTGIHSANKNLLVKWAGESHASQHSGYGRNTFLRPMSAEEQAELLRLVAEAKAANLAMDKYIDKFSVDVRDLIEQAQLAEAKVEAETEEQS